MRILLITDNHEPNMGGAEKFFFALKNQLQSQTQADVYSVGFASKAAKTRDSVTLKQCDNGLNQLLWKLLLHPIKYFQLKKIIAEQKPDIIHFHNTRNFTPTLLKAAKGYPCIQTTHDFSTICPTSWNLHSNLEVCATGFSKACWSQHRRSLNPLMYLALLTTFIRRRALLKKYIQLFLAPSPLLTRYLLNNEFPACYLPPFVSHDADPAFNNIRNNEFVYIGQLGKHKGIEELVSEFAIACKKNTNLILKIAGKGKLEKTLKQTVLKLGLEKNILFLGWQDPQSLYESSSALVFPSIGLESFGLVITEAMSHARAVIGTDRGPTSWLVEDGRTGLLFDPLKKGDLAEKILNFSSEPQLAIQYGTAAKERLKGLPDDKTILTELMEIYRVIIKKHQRQPHHPP